MENTNCNKPLPTRRLQMACPCFDSTARLYLKEKLRSLAMLIVRSKPCCCCDIQIYVFVWHHAHLRLTFVVGDAPATTAPHANNEDWEAAKVELGPDRE